MWYQNKHLKGHMYERLKIIFNKLKMLREMYWHICNKKNPTFQSLHGLLYITNFVPPLDDIFISLLYIHWGRNTKSDLNILQGISGRCVLLATKKKKKDLKFTFKIEIDLFRTTILAPFPFSVYPGFSQGLSKWLTEILRSKVNIPDVPKSHVQHILPVVSRPLGYLRQETPWVEEGLGCQWTVDSGF